MLFNIDNKTKAVIAGFLILVLPIFALLFSGCELLGGSDTETGRKDTGSIEGRIVDGGGNPAQGVALRLFKSSFNPFRDHASGGTNFVTTATDDSGMYVFGNLDSTFSYNLLGKRKSNTTLAFRANLRPGGPVDTMQLDLPVRLELTLTYLDYPYNEGDSTTAYFPGTDIFFACDSFTAVDTLPVGVVNLVVDNAKNESGSAALPNNNGDWGAIPYGRGGDTIRVDVQKYLGQPYLVRVLP